MKLNFICALLLCLFAINDVTAKHDSARQYDNTLMICGADYMLQPRRTYRTLAIWQDEMIGIAFQKKVWKNIHCKATYTEWNNMPWFGLIWRGDGLRLRPGYDMLVPGVIMTMSKYKMVDLYFLYKIDCFRKHKITAGAGITYAKGINEVVDSIYYNPAPPHDGIIYTSTVKRSYWGVVPAISYDYLLFKNRMAVGADLRYRRYTRHPFYAAEYGFHVGVNF